ncbi:ABC transporter permease [Yoonia sediminilitoris]|uniref:NitT/TauT family transport system permease protein n=1 Tax=Yoonia sediminilitoris TaxID=1286148 RepID=A0A2T6KS98_9RHOB|nr:ABC transporter permease [Yoonia sediminilitoris]PUB19421.1 NitT/TauT family transport system permease protein [Yoonia sediminilitoris]RCW99589.1 NitT/TauT family transport system permease protein [Yoonia sediminilitoris]
MSIRIFSLLGLLALWAAVAWIAADPQVLPMPHALVLPFWEEATSGELFYHLGRTLIRVIWAFALAMSIGLALGLVMGLLPTVDRWLDPWLVVFLNLPALVLIVLCYLWIGLNETAAIIAVTLNKIPNVTTIIREGARAMDPNLRDMARVFRMPRGTVLRHIILPQMAPFIAGAARSGVAVIWKIVLVVEFLGRSNGIGFQIHLYFQLFDVLHVLIYALSFIAVMLLVEWLVLQPWEARVRRWRGA